MPAALLDLEPAAVDDAARRVMARCDELAKISAARDRIERVYLSGEHAAANRLAASWMREAGLEPAQDAAGNLVGRAAVGPAALAADPDTPALLLGSHLDTVPDAGRYDGILGVLVAIEVVRLLRPRLDTFPFALEVAAFWDEEGTRFGKALLGSSAVGGVWDPAWWDLADANGVGLRQAFTDFGLDPDRVSEAARQPGSLVGYLEAHIEQGPVLDDAGLPLAVVSSIAGARRFEVAVHGEARHAGGTPYEARHDALLGASEAVVAVERLCRSERHVIGTVGRLDTPAGAMNVVPGEARFTLDLRGELDSARDLTWAAIAATLDEVAGRRGLRWEAREVHNAAALTCDPLLADVLRAGVSTGTGAPEAPTLFSPAGHDGMALGGLTDVGMLFLRNPDGISHHPAEDVTTEDVGHGIAALAAAVAHLAEEHTRRP